ncbi:uncharacterized protein BCR38DRAFT_343226 [Pseudomassariella vexata]|uniref:Early meiotic induction protein 1 n=1 Tax=Pseudomassariella vexata TaxID=1141098 RepID=A0A1Y2DXF8_9PEZI|nr:uncharacterized protein BCR38DRAFT_343226 [Pseudomassariella vexata]ORY63980.1 hypothetical protein BCR38DRAFT_343226 [Pseudomassariella vexata]
MGWLWASSPTARALDSDKPTSPAPTSSPAPDSPPVATRAPESDYSDPEIAKFIAQVQAEFGSASSSKPTEPSRPAAAPALEPPKPAATVTSHTATPLQTLDPISESTLPTTMSCRQAFDAAFYCQSVGSQFHAIYRQGEVRGCSELWDDFWFCMRTRGYSGKIKEEAIKDHYRRKELSKYYGPGKPSSTDVWESREEKVPWDSEFRQSYPRQPDVSDEEWRIMEIERRRRAQEELDREAGGRLRE